MSAKETMKEYYKNHIKEIKKYQHRYYLKHKRKLKMRSRKIYDLLDYKPKTKAKYRRRQKIYDNKHRKEINAKQRKHYKAMYKSNIQYTLKKICCARIRVALRAQHAERLAPYPVLIGCSWKELQKYISTKFRTNMTWKTWGKKVWNIDHIRPVSSYDLHNVDQQKKAFCFENMQPLFISEHIKKSQKYINTLETKISKLKNMNKEYRKALKQVI